MPHSPSGFASIAPPIRAVPSIRMVLKALRSSASDIAFRMSGLSNGGLTRLTIRLICVPVVIISQIAFGARALMSFSKGNADVGGEGDVVLAGRESQHPRGAVVDGPHRDLVEIGTVLLEVIGIAHEADRFAALEFDEFERPGADRFGPHDLLRNMAGIDRRERARQQHRQARLRLAQFERRLIIAVDADVLQLGVPDLARVAMKILGIALADQHPPGALHVLGGKRLAVVPLHALAQLEGQFGVGCVPRPAFGEIGDHGLEALMRLGGIEHDEIVEHGRKRHHRSDGRFFQQRCRRRIVVVIEPERAALFLRGGRACRAQREGKQRQGSNPQPVGRIGSQFRLPECFLFSSSCQSL